MILKAFSLHDSKAKVFNPPYYKGSPGEAERALKDLVNDPQSTVGRHTEDFALFEVGSYDDNTGMFTPTEPRHIINAIQLKV